MCTTAMAAAKGMLPSHDDSAMLQWRREAVHHRLNGYLDNHVRVTQAKEQAVQNMAKLQQQQVSIFLLQSEPRLGFREHKVARHRCKANALKRTLTLHPVISCFVARSSTPAGFLTLSGAMNSRILFL